MSINWQSIGCHKGASGYLAAKNTPREIMAYGSSWHQSRKKSTGFSYMEVLVATFLIAILLIPAMESLHSGILGSEVHAMQVDNHYRLTGKLEELLAEPFTSLEQAADTAGGASVIVDAYSDAAGSDWRRLVYLARYDADNADTDNDPFTGTDRGLIWIRIQIEDSPAAIETLTSH